MCLKNKEEKIENILESIMYIIVSIGFCIIVFFAVKDMSLALEQAEIKEEKIKIIEHEFGKDFNTYEEFIIWKYEKIKGEI